jgi:putative transposase
MPKGYVYLMAIMDWYSRYVLEWELSVTMATEFCLEALNRALQKAVPQIFNSDQGSQFTSLAFTGRLLEKGITISRAGRGAVSITSGWSRSGARSSRRKFI